MAQPLERRGIGLTIDLVELPRFGLLRLTAVGAEAGEAPASVAADLEHRMNDEMHRDAGASEGDADRLDEKGSVIGDDLYERMG